MGRHEIRLRRNRMTSRRMERHKNYQDILRQHRRQQRGRFVRILVYLLALLALLLVIYMVLHRIGSDDTNDKTRPVTAQISRPGIEFSPNIYEHGIKKKPPA